MARYDPDKYHRQSIRLKPYDYTQEGAYFVTICTRGRELYFELYPELRHIVQAQWESLPKRFQNISLDAFVIMPNHLHAIILVGATLAVAQNPAAAQNFVGAVLVAAPTLAAVQNPAGANPAAAPNRTEASPAPTALGNIVGAFKSFCVNRWLRYIKQNHMDAVGSIWQRNYYEHVIRNETELNRVREYIVNNPLNWPFDRENPIRITDPAYLAEWKWLEAEA
jgi:putative transposase